MMLLREFNQVSLWLDPSIKWFIIPNPNPNPTAQTVSGGQQYPHSAPIRQCHITELTRKMSINESRDRPDRPGWLGLNVWTVWRYDLVGINVMTVCLLDWIGLGWIGDEIYLPFSSKLWVHRLLTRCLFDLTIHVDYEMIWMKWWIKLLTRNLSQNT